MRKLFPVGRLRKFKPHDLVPRHADKKDDDEIPGIFLTFGLIYNDLKSLMIIHDDFFELYEKPDATKASTQLGEWSGMEQTFHKILAGVLYEFLEFIRRHEQGFESSTFKYIEQELSQSDRNIWNLLFAMATGRETENTPLAESLMRIRHNVAFHYSASDLLRGYRAHFFGNSPGHSATDFAYSTIKGKDIVTSRIFYSDAALGGYYRDLAGKNDALNQMLPFAGDVSRCILALISGYEATKPAS